MACPDEVAPTNKKGEEGCAPSFPTKYVFPNKKDDFLQDLTSMPPQQHAHAFFRKYSYVLEVHLISVPPS
jgi:hypothetical protein